MEPGLSKVLDRRAGGAKSFVLLLLLAHALVASATHFHHAAGLYTAGAQGAALSREKDGGEAPLTNGDEQCLACRLQRNFASGLVRHAAPEVAPQAARPTGFASPGATSDHSAHTLSATGRAPPLS